MSQDIRRQGAALAAEIRSIASSIGRPVRVMEVCGTHTVSLRRHGIHSLLPKSVELISGPGCPVCVTPVGYIDNARALVESGRVAIATFGDMVKVPGSDGRTLSELSSTGRVRIVYSPMQLADLIESLDSSIERLVFLAIGFETTIPTVLRSAVDAFGRGERRMLYYTAFKLVPPALTALLSDARHGIDGFLLPGHVSMVIGSDAYSFLPSYGVPGAITGFEPLEMLRGIRSVLSSIAEGRSVVTNEYAHVVRPAGNRKARELMARMLEPADAVWRGLGRIEASALVFRTEYADLDAAQVLSLSEEQVADPPGCLCGDVIRGRAIPTSCAHFGVTCTPEDPVGPCMVSSEGTCAAYLKYAAITA